MNWGSFAEFAAMRGYGLYVWGAYGMTAAIMLLEPWLVRQHRRRALRAAASLSPEDRSA